MQLDLGHKIRELRRRDGRTQEALAEALGVTSQAISRWESNGGYPDMEMIPAIANFFHVSIDELFGYHDNREERIKKILEEARRQIQNQGNVLGKDNEHEGTHPLNHIDVNYTNKNTYKIGLPSRWGCEKMIDFVNIKKTCSFIADN